MIKKRQVKAKALTKRAREDEDEIENQELKIEKHEVQSNAIKNNDVAINIELAKIKQKVRSRTHGMKIQDTKTGSLVDDKERERRARQREAEKKNIIQGGLLGGLIERSRDGNFLFQNKEIQEMRGETQFTTQSKSDIDIKMEEYVESELKKKGYAQKGQEQPTKTDDFLQSEVDLYKIPEHLRVTESLFKDEIDAELKRKEALTRSRTGEVMTVEDERNQVLSGGILEVPLPIEYKIKNIEETERVKELLKNQVPEQSSVTAQNFNMNYNMHHRRYLQEQIQSFETFKEAAEQEVEEEYDDDYDARDSEEENFEKQTSMSAFRKQQEQQSETASDEKLLERFKKRFRRRY
jgi:hypothetical protein